MRNAGMEEAQAGIKIAGRNINNLSLLQPIFPIQESNWGLLPCRCILYQLSYQGSPKSERKLLSHVQLFATLWIIQSMEFSRPEYWSG